MSSVMGVPQIRVLGVYRNLVTEELLQEQFQILYDYEMSEADRRRAYRNCRDQLDSVVLIELLVNTNGHPFNPGDLTQWCDGLPMDSWQAPWAEAYLSLDGKSLLVERGASPPNVERFRYAFFLHVWQQHKPLLTSQGELDCPRPVEMPERLRRLVRMPCS